MRVPAPVIPLLCVLALLALAAGCGPVGGTGSGVPHANAAGGDSQLDVGRFSVRAIDVRRGPPILFRFDSATGESWSKNLMEDGSWNPIGETEGQEPEPGTETERYYMKNIAMQRGAPNLLRVDTVTGKAWRKGARSGGPWVLIPQPDPNAKPNETPAAAPDPEPAPETGSEGETPAAS